MRTTVASVCEGIRRILSSLGTSVPNPRTCTIIGPRLTVSGQTVLASIVGAAGFNRYTAAAAAATAISPIAPITICRRNFFFLISGRAISISHRYCNYGTILCLLITLLDSDTMLGPFGTAPVTTGHFRNRMSISGHLRCVGNEKRVLIRESGTEASF